jgi:uncharacterized protein (UPF0128 family)
MTIKAADIREIASLVQLNLHGDAYHLAAVKLELPELAETFAKINAEHMRLGYLEVSLSNRQRRAYEQLLKSARQKMNPSGYAWLYRSL